MAKTETYGWQVAVPHTAAYLARVVREQLELIAAQRILDAGCGNGALAGFLSHEGFAVVGIDGDEGGIAIARQHYLDVAFEVGLFSAAPPAEDFDAVVSTEVVEHLYAPHELVSYAWNALRPGGHLVISTPYHGYFKNVVLSLANKWDSHHTALWHGGHIKFWSRRTLTRLLESNGFLVVNFEGAGRVPYLWKSMILVARKVEING